ncbi:MAG: TIM barrel protein, partial [Thermofilaceae archaeon]
MKISIMTRVFWKCYEWPGRTFNFTLVEILKRIVKNYYRAVDLCEYPLEFWPSAMSEREKKQLKELLEHLNLKASGITIPTFAPGLELLPTEADRVLAFKRLKNAIHLAHYLEGDTVMYGISPLPVFGVPSEKAYRWTLELVSKSARLAEESGVQLAIEFVNIFFTSSESILNFLETVGSDSVGLCLEVSNVHARPNRESLEEHIDA